MEKQSKVSKPRKHKDTPMSDEALAFSQRATSAGEAMIPRLGAVDSARALMSAAISVAIDKHGANLSAANVANWLIRLAAEVKATGGSSEFAEPKRVGSKIKPTEKGVGAPA